MSVLDDTTDDKLESLAKHLECDSIDLDHVDGDCTFGLGNQEYLVLTDIEADAKCNEYILDIVWAFNASFLASHIEALTEDMIDRLRGDSCEDCNDALVALLDDKEHFLDDAIASDGRGHFMNSYDGEEIELNNDFYAYRVN